MNDLEQWKMKIHAVLERREQEIRTEQDKLSMEMQRSEELKSLFQPVADRIIEMVITPRIKVFAEQWDDADIYAPRAGVVGLVFNRDRRYAASIKLYFTITLGQEGEIIIVFRPEILPIFVPVPHTETLTFPLDKIDDRLLIEWVEEKIVKFAEAYMMVALTPAYHYSNMVTDPVCGMKFKKEYAVAQADHCGITVYFCVPECKTKFLQSPDQYAAHVK